MLEEVKRVYARDKKQNDIVLIFDLQQSSNISYKMAWPLFSWLRATKPFLSECLDYTHVVGVEGLWKKILLTMKQLISTARPVHIDVCPKDLLDIFQ